MIKVGALKPLSKLQRNYNFIQTDFEVNELITDYTEYDEYYFSYAVVKMGEGDYKEVWLGDSADLDASYELVYLGSD